MRFASGPFPGFPRERIPLLRFPFRRFAQTVPKVPELFHGESRLNTRGFRATFPSPAPKKQRVPASHCGIHDVEPRTRKTRPLDNVRKRQTVTVMMVSEGGNQDRGPLMPCTLGHSASRMLCARAHIALDIGNDGVPGAAVSAESLRHLPSALRNAQYLLEIRSHLAQGVTVVGGKPHARVGDAPLASIGAGHHGISRGDELIRPRLDSQEAVVQVIKLGDDHRAGLASPMPWRNRARPLIVSEPDHFQGVEILGRETMFMMGTRFVACWAFRISCEAAANWSTNRAFMASGGCSRNDIDGVVGSAGV